MGRLAPADEANLVLDHVGQVNVFLVAGLLSPGGFVGSDGVTDMAALRAAVAARVAALPQLRQVATPHGRRHRWAEVAPDLAEHVRSVDEVVGRAGLERLCGELMSVPLPSNRPLWELLIVPVASADGVGVVLRIHHAVADGMTAVAMVRRLFDRSEVPAEPADSPHGTDGDEPGRGLRCIVPRIAFGLRRMQMTLSGREVGVTALLGERGANRGVLFLGADIGLLEVHARERGATVNDALLAAVASGYRAVLPAVGEVVPRLLPVSVPVALRRRGTSGNQVGVMLVRLPLGEPNPDDRLRLIADQTRTEKIRARQQGTLEFMRGPAGARIMDRIAHRQHLVAGFVTNVPGPAGPLRLAGAPVREIWPVAVLAANVRLGVAALSYDGRLGCGIHFDARTVPGMVFARAMHAELARLTGQEEPEHATHR